MNDTQILEVLDSWNIEAIGVVTEIKHELEGIATGTIVKSQKTNLEWRVKKRLVFSHTSQQQKKFPNEITTLTYVRFENPQKQSESAKNILAKEEKNIFSYLLQPIGHASQPEHGDGLVILIPERFACPCCGYKTFYEEPSGNYGICQVCFWEDDPIQLHDPHFEGGANRISLKQAQKNFINFGACEMEMLKNVRPPNKEEERENSWKPLE
jgi:hypothetical protein